MLLIKIIASDDTNEKESAVYYNFCSNNIIRYNNHQENIDFESTARAT